MEAEGLTAGVEFEVAAGPDHYLVGEETGPARRSSRARSRCPGGRRPTCTGLFATGPTAGWSSAPEEGRPADRRRQPDPGQQRRDAGQRPPHPGPRPRVVPLDRHRGLARARSSAPSWATWSDPVVVEVPMGTPLIELIDVHAGGLEPGRYVKAVLSGFSNAGADRRRPGDPGQLRGAAWTPAAAWAPPGSSSTTTARTWSRSPAWPATSSTSRAAASARPASSGPATSPSASTASPAPAATTATSRPSGPGC